MLLLLKCQWLFEPCMKRTSPFEMIAKAFTAISTYIHKVSRCTVAQGKDKMNIKDGRVNPGACLAVRATIISDSLSPDTPALMIYYTIPLGGALH